MAAAAAAAAAFQWVTPRHIQSWAGRSCAGSGRPAQRAGGAVRLLAVGREGDPSSWPARELRAFLDEQGVRHADCFEKRELVERVKEALLQEASAGRRQQRQQRPEQQPDADADAARFASFPALETVEEKDRNAAVASMIFLHGLGDTGQGWVKELPNMLGVPEMRYLLPTAETVSFSFAAGARRVASWFDAGAMRMMMAGGSTSNPMETVGSDVMQKSLDYCHHLIRREVQRGVPPGRIFLGGFSQGGCLAVRAAVSFPDAPLGGCIGASTFLGDAGRLPVAEANARLQVLVCHGDADRVVSPAAGRRLADSLRARGLPVELQSYPGMDHTTCPQEVADVRRFVRRRLLAEAGVEGLQRLSARELKAALLDVGVDISGCFEKSDMLERAQATFA